MDSCYEYIPQLWYPRYLRYLRYRSTVCRKFVVALSGDAVFAARTRGSKASPAETEQEPVIVAR